MRRLYSTSMSSKSDDFTYDSPSSSSSSSSSDEDEQDESVLSCKSSSTAGSTTVASIGEQTAQDFVDGEHVVSSIPFFSSILPSISRASSTTTVDTRDKYESSVAQSYSRDSSYEARTEYEESVRSYLPSISEATDSIEDKQGKEDDDDEEEVFDDQQGTEKQIKQEEEEEEEEGIEKQIQQEEGQDHEQDERNEDRNDEREEEVQKGSSRSFWGYFFSRTSSAAEKKDGLGAIVEDEEDNGEMGKSFEEGRSQIEPPSKSGEEMERKESSNEEVVPEAQLQRHRSSTTEVSSKKTEGQCSQRSECGEIVTIEDFNRAAEEDQQPVLEEVDKVSVNYSVFGESVTYEDFNQVLEDEQEQEHPLVLKGFDEQSYDCSEWGHNVTLEDFNRVLEEQRQEHSVLESVSTIIDDNKEYHPDKSESVMRIVIAPASSDGAINQDRYCGPIEKDTNTEKYVERRNAMLSSVHSEHDDDVCDRYSPASKTISEKRKVEIREIATNLLLNSPRHIDVYSSESEEEKEVVLPTKNNIKGDEQRETLTRDEKILKGLKKDKRQPGKNGASRRPSPKKKQIHDESRDPSPQRKSVMRSNRDRSLEHPQKAPISRHRGRTSSPTKKSQEELHLGNGKAHPKHDVPSRKQPPIRGIKDQISQKHRNHAQKWSTARLESSSLPRQKPSSLFSKEALAGAAKAFFRGNPRKSNRVIAGKKKGSDKKIKSHRPDTVHGSERKIKSQRQDTGDKKKKRPTTKKSAMSYQQRELEETSQYRVEILSRF